MWTALVEGYKIDLSLRDDELWHAIRRERPLTICANCFGNAHTVSIPGVDAKGQPTELRIFAHNPGEGQRCRLLGGDESPEHHGFKATIATAVRLTPGWRAELEVMSADERCRADVVAHGPSGQTWALEAQLARLGVPDAHDRHERYIGAWSNTTWLHTRRREWAHQIPSLRVDDEELTDVVGGLFIDDGGEISAPRVSVAALVPRLIRQERITYIYGDEREDWGFYRDLSIQPAAASVRQPTPSPRAVRVLSGATVGSDCERPPTAPPPPMQRMVGEHQPTSPRYPVRGTSGFCQWCHAETRWNGRAWVTEDAAPCAGSPPARPA
jgi:hypothetical protein